MTFHVGHKLNIGNKYAVGNKHTEEWKKAASQRMKGNTNGFQNGKPSPRKGRKSSVSAWNKGLKGFFAGEKHPNWIKDRTKLAKKQIRNDSAYKDWRRQVWLRDNWKCKINNLDCNGKIVAHHILRWIDYPELRYDVNNGITLCHLHHPKKRKEEDQLASLYHTLVTNEKSN